MTPAGTFDFLLPLLTASVVPKAIDWLKRTSETIDASHRRTKQALVFVCSGALTTFATLAATWAGFPTDALEWKEVAIQSLVGGLLAIVGRQDTQVVALKSLTQQETHP